MREPYIYRADALTTNRQGVEERETLVAVALDMNEAMMAFAGKLQMSNGQFPNIVKIERAEKPLMAYSIEVRKEYQ